MTTPQKFGRLLGAVAAALTFSSELRPQAARSPARAMLRSGTLSFVGHATTGSFVGTTTVAAGEVEGDLSSARGWVEAPVASLKTRNDLRDRDMRAALEATKYPTMRFDLARVTLLSPAAGGADTATVQLLGRLTIHGVTRQVELPASISFGGASIHVTALFPLDVEQYRIGGLTKMFGLLRMERMIDVRLDLRFAIEPAPAQAGGT